jgi:hypothetical protein
MNEFDRHATIEETTELRDLARVIKTALGVVLAYWRETLPPSHPYRQAARMIESYLGRRYGV